jgi:hypothetical protein
MKCMPNLTFQLRDLEAFWELPNGFFYRLRQGDYDPEAADGVIRVLQSLSVGEDELLARRFVSLTWFIPLFMEWQVERVKEQGGDTTALRRHIEQLTNVVSELLGMP